MLRLNNAVIQTADGLKEFRKSQYILCNDNNSNTFILSINCTKITLCFPTKSYSYFLNTRLQCHAHCKIAFMFIWNRFHICMLSCIGYIVVILRVLVTVLIRTLFFSGMSCTSMYVCMNGENLCLSLSNVFPFYTFNNIRHSLRTQLKHL